MICTKCKAEVPETAIRNGKCVSCRSLENAWQSITAETPVDSLTDEEFIWLAFNDGSVRMGRYVNPPFCGGHGHPQYYFGTILFRMWDDNDQPIKWMKILSPQHPFTK